MNSHLFSEKTPAHCGPRASGVGLRRGCGRRADRPLSTFLLSPLFTIVLCTTVVAGVPLSVRADTVDRSFTRIVPARGQRGEQLQTAIMQYELPSTAGRPAARVALVATLHLAEPGYYEQLSKRLMSYDRVLYELVLSDDKPVISRGIGHLISVYVTAFVLNYVEDTFNLAFQLDVIDYSKRNFVHADVTEDDLEAEYARLAANPELAALPPAVTGDSSAGAYSVDEFLERELSIDNLLRILFSSGEQRLNRVRSLLAHALLIEEDADLNPVILRFRNNHVLKVLSRALTERGAGGGGQGKRTVAIFYGAAHMPDLAATLRRSYRAKLVSVEWLPAWFLPAVP